MKNNYIDSMSPTGEEFGGMIPLAVCNKAVTCDLSGDFTVPDYLPEIRRLIRVNVTPTAPSKFISGGDVKLGGGVDYTVHYIGADGGLYSAAFPGEYSFIAPFDTDVEYDMNEGLDACGDVTVDSVVGRVNSARKIGIKARMTAHVTVLGACRTDPPRWLNEPAHSDTQKLVKQIAYCRQRVGSNDEIELADSLDLVSENSRLISADCSMFLEEVSCGEGYIDCRGSVKVKYLLSKNGETVPYTLEHRMSLSEIVEMDGVTSGMATAAYCVCTGIDTAERDGGEGIECKVRLRLSAVAFGEEKMSYISDAYSTAYECKCEKVPMKLPQMKCCAVKNITFDGVSPLDKLPRSGEGDEVSIISVSATALSSGLEYSEESGKTFAAGNVTFNILYSCGEGELSAAEIELPFKIEGSDLPSDAHSACCYATVFDPRVRIGTSGLELGCEISVSCHAFSYVTVDAVSDLSLGEKLEGDRGGISICYPDGEDSLWSIAKKYRACAETVAAENGISSDSPADDRQSLEKLRYLII